jgi:hypothetical protein
VTVPLLVGPDSLSLYSGTDTRAHAGAAVTSPSSIRSRLTVLRRKTVRPGGLRLEERDYRLLAAGTAAGQLVASWAWRWEWPRATTVKSAQNRLSELKRHGLLERVELRVGVEGVYVPTAEAARLVAPLTDGLSAPRLPDRSDVRWHATLPHALTVMEVGRWLLTERAPAGARWRTERDILRSRVLALPAAARRGGAGLGFRPDGELLLPAGERLAVEVELHDKADRLADKLAWYRDAAGYDEVLWLVPPVGVEAPLGRAIEAAGCGALMAVEPLPTGCLVYAG